MSSAFTELLDLAERLGITVRHARLGGAGGGLAQLRGKRLLFVDLEAMPDEQLDRTVSALASLPADELERVFVRPDVRDMLDRARADS